VQVRVPVLGIGEFLGFLIEPFLSALDKYDVEASLRGLQRHHDAGRAGSDHSEISSQR
jgi:hypothetical protein